VVTLIGPYDMQLYFLYTFSYESVTVISWKI